MRWILRFRIFIIICLAVALISAAIVFSVLRAVLPHAIGYKNEIQQEISQQIGLPVEIDTIDAAIHWFSPRLKLIDVSVFDKKYKVPLFNFHEAFVELDVISSILRGEIIVDDVGLIGADLSIEKLSDTEWLVQGVKYSSEGSSELPERFLYMLQNSDYLLQDSNIYYQDHTGEKLRLSLLDVNIVVKNNFNNHDIKFTMNLPEEYGHDLSVVANLRGDIDSLDGDIYVEANRLKVKQWNKKFKFLHEYQLDAALDISIWARLDDNNIQEFTTQFTSKNLFINNKVTGKSWETGYLSTNIRYVDDGDFWNVAVSDLVFGDRSKPSWQQPANIVASIDERNYYLSADILRITDLQAIVETFLTDEQMLNLDKFKAYQIAADIYNLNLQLPRDVPREQILENLYLDAAIKDFSMREDTRALTLSGFDASVHIADQRAEIDVVTQDAQVAMQKLFRGPLVAETIQGQLTLDYHDNTWHLNTDQLQLKNSHINTFSRLDITLSTVGDIFVDVQTDFYDAYGKYAKFYLPVGLMNPGLVDWIDKAVTDGYVPNGTFILHGDLNDFPYDKHNGVFQVLFSPQDVSMQFLDDWPLLTNASGSVKFNNLSLYLTDAKGKINGASLFNGYAEILNLPESHLTITTNAHTKNEDVQSFIWNSPLNKFLGPTMRLFQLAGESDLNLKLDVPLNQSLVEVAIDGHLKLIDTEMYYPTMGYEISDMNGLIDFTKNSIFTDSMTAKIQNRNVSINAFTQDGKSGRENVFHLDGVMSADYLLQRHDWIPKGWISGQSMWSLELEVPYHPKEYLVHINASSFLEDVVLQVSDKVNKPVANKVVFTTEIDILDDDGLQLVAGASGTNDGVKKTYDILKLYAHRNAGKVWDFDIDSKYMTGKGEFAEGLDRDTQIKLDLENIDLHALFVTKNKKKSNALKPEDFPSLNWKVKKLLWDDWLFTDVIVQTDWHKHGMLINKYSLKGPSMTFDASGTWLTSWRGAHETVLNGNITSTNFGDTLTGLGFERSIDRSQYKATFDARWPAEPYGFSWGNMKGETSFEMENGEILEADPGAGGRLLGLLNIFKLTNRLAFDFDDVTREGFSFDTIRGDFEFVDGDGSLKNFDVTAPAADINMFGSVGLIKRDYGLLMRVKPHTDTLTFAGGMLLGGVVVGAGLALIQKVFDLGVIGHNVYSITGSWDDPKIEKIIQRNVDADVEENDF